MTDEKAQAARERARRNSAAYRARKREADAERARVTADGAPGVMRQSVDSSIAAAKWLAGTDAASIAQARALANIIDGTEDGRLQLRAHGLLSRVLGEMGLTARVRTQLELRAQKMSTVVTAAVIDRQPNVTRLQRPAKRR
jgi:hypothetical protein